MAIGQEHDRHGASAGERSAHGERAELHERGEREHLAIASSRCTDAQRTGQSSQSPKTSVAVLPSAQRSTTAASWRPRRLLVSR